MNAALFEQLLHEEESNSLDFKIDQYPFAGATEDNKAKILKDTCDEHHCDERREKWMKSSKAVYMGCTTQP